MSVAIAIGALVGVGCIGMLRGLRTERPTLEAIAAALDRWSDAGTEPHGQSDSPSSPGFLLATSSPVLTGRLGLPRPSIRSGSVAIVELMNRSAVTKRWWRSLGPSFAITGVSPEQVAAKMLVLGGTGLLAPPSAWLISEIAGLFPVPLGIPALISLVATPFLVALPVIRLVSQARERQHHACVVVSSFVDLVVLNLAGGMGIESALLDCRSGELGLDGRANLEIAADCAGGWPTVLVGAEPVGRRDRGARVGRAIGDTSTCWHGGIAHPPVVECSCYGPSET